MHQRTSGQARKNIALHKHKAKANQSAMVPPPLKGTKSPERLSQAPNDGEIQRHTNSALNAKVKDSIFAKRRFGVRKREKSKVAKWDAKALLPFGTKWHMQSPWTKLPKPQAQRYRHETKASKLQTTSSRKVWSCERPGSGER